MHRLLGALSGRRRHHLLERQREGLLGCVIGGRGGDERRAGLMVPERKLRHVALADIGKAGDEVLDRHRLSVMAVEIEIHALLEEVRPEHASRSCA